MKKQGRGARPLAQGYLDKGCWNGRSSILARRQTPGSLRKAASCTNQSLVPRMRWMTGLRGALLIYASPACLGLVSTLGRGGAIQRCYVTEACAFGSRFRRNEGLWLVNWKQLQHCFLDLIDSAPELEIVFVTLSGFSPAFQPDLPVTLEILVGVLPKIEAINHSWPAN